MTPKRKAELDKLAIDIRAGQVFGSWNVSQADNIPMVFITLALMNKEDRKSLMDAGVVHLYEYMRKATPRSFNGMPTFVSFSTLTQPDVDYLRARTELLQAAEVAATQQPIEGA